MYLKDAEAIFEVMDRDGNKTIDFDEFFTALVAGPIMSNPKFEKITWSE